MSSATSVSPEVKRGVPCGRRRVLPCGAELDGGATRLRLWAPDASSVELLALLPDGQPYQSRLIGCDGWHELRCDRLPAGSRYQYRIDGALVVPDPAARFNPHGVHGASEVIDPLAFAWHDAHWRGRPWHEAVLYELHVGTFSAAGTFNAIVPRLRELADLGVTALELLPVATFPGERGWGYDGVLQFAPHPAYGRPEELKQLVQAAHALDLMVLLDVVYNHFGPDGNFLPHYARGFFAARHDTPHDTPWGAALDFESRSQFGARRFFIENALYWLEEYHFDGLRLDAVHAIHDRSDPHFIDELAQEIERGPGSVRHVHLILENSANQASRLRTSPSTRVSRSQWNDDFHHALHVLLSGESDGYYRDYADRPLQHLGRVLSEGFAFQGEISVFANNCRRGERSNELPPTAFVNFLQNHDQVGNRALGERLVQLTAAPQLRAALAILLLAPQPPMLFMGEEYAAAQPFYYFCDYQGELARAITAGRRNEFASFAAFADPAARECIPDPNAVVTFMACKLAWHEREQEPHRQWLDYVRELLQARRRCLIPLIEQLLQSRATYSLSGAVLSIAWPLQSGSRLLMRANLSAIDAAVTCGGEPAATLLFRSAEAGSGSGLTPWEVQLLLA